jgi:hypothetical protein
MRTLLFGAALVAPSFALACPGRTATASAATPSSDAAHAAADAASCAKRAELVGDACSYTTGMMAQRVLAEGREFTFTGTMAAAPAALESHVAAPFLVGDGVHVVANEVIDGVPATGRVTLVGKRLDVNGVDYFVVTSFTALSST